MNCKRCGKTITEHTFRLYRKRCVPCFNRLPMQRLKNLCSETLPILAMILALPILAVFHCLRKLWHTIAPVPFRRSEIISRMTPHFGPAGAIQYVNGLKKGFHKRIPRRVCYCGTHTIRTNSKTPDLTLCQTIGREDGARLQLKPMQLQKILDQRCSKPYKSRSRSPRRKLIGKRITIKKQANKQ